MIDSCRLCGSKNFYLYYTLGNDQQFRYYRCRECDLVNYDLEGGLDQEQYAEEFIDPADGNHIINIHQDDTYDFLKKNIHSKGRIFEIGCGNGRVLYLAREDGWEVKGLELSEFLAEKVTERLNMEIEVANFLELNPDPNDKHDLIILRHVLEHLIDPLIAMDKISNLLKPEGKVLMEFPNIQGIDLRVKRLLSKMGRRKKFAEDFVPGHVNEYSKRSYKNLLTKTGFTLLKWETYSSNRRKNFLHKRIHIGNKARALIQKV